MVPPASLLPWVTLELFGSGHCGSANVGHCQEGQAQIQPSIHGEKDVWGATFLFSDSLLLLLPLPSGLISLLFLELSGPAATTGPLHILLSSSPKYLHAAPLMPLRAFIQMSPSLPLILNSTLYPVLF